MVEPKFGNYFDATMEYNLRVEYGAGNFTEESEDTENGVGRRKRSWEQKMEER